jgi:hypothetical protein
VVHFLDDIIDSAKRQGLLVIDAAVETQILAKFVIEPVQILIAAAPLDGGEQLQRMFRKPDRFPPNACGNDADNITLISR